MGSSAWIVSSLAFVMLGAGIASADSVIVIRGSEVSVEEEGEREAPEIRRRAAPADPVENAIAPAPASAAAEASQISIVFVDARTYAQVVWAFANPWEGDDIRVHGPGRLEASQGGTYSRWSARETSRIRVHSGLERPVAAVGQGGGGSNIKVHRMGARTPSHIRVHGGAGWGR